MNNPFLVCSDRELRALPTQWLRAERWDKTGSTLYDLTFMEATVMRLGVDELLQEYDAALRLLPRGDWNSKLTSTRRVLERQAHNLRDWDAEAQPVFFHQQMRNEAFQFDLHELQERLESNLAQQDRPYLRERFKIGHMAPELMHVLQGHTDSVSCMGMSADGRLAVSASWQLNDTTMIVWDITSGLKQSSLSLGPGFLNKINAVALSADGQLVVSASTDKSLKSVESGDGPRTAAHAYRT